jgi:hypothetical protein
MRTWKPMVGLSPGVENCLVAENWRARAFAWGRIVAWVVPCAAICWVLRDPHALAALRHSWWGLLVPAVAADPVAQLRLSGVQSHTYRVALNAGMVVCGVSLGVYAMSLVWGATRQRTITGVMSLTSIVAIWLVIATNLVPLYDCGVRHRIQASSPALQGFTDQLQQDWPQRADQVVAPGSRFEQLPPVNAYPLLSPRVCLLLSSYSVPGTSMEIVALEYTPGEAMRLQLSGALSGYWFERRWDQSPPTNFFSGLDEPLEPNRYRSLGDQCYLVVY